MRNRAEISARRASSLGAIVAVGAAIGVSAWARADEASDIRAGQELAARVCSPCHVIAPSAGPSFAEIANGDKAAPESLRAFLRSVHISMSHPGAMPNPELTEQQIRQISAYIATLRTAK